MDTQQNRQQNLPPAVPSVWPSLSFTDAEQGVRLLSDVLGFVVTVIHRDDDGVVQHAEARWPDGGGVMFGTRGKPGDWGRLEAQGVYIVAAEPATVDAVWERVQAEADLEVLEPLGDTDYGSHQFGFRDRDGNLWSLGTYRGE
ncbi:VOC family protein [Brevibacterium daeguense]|uniref:VOC family protein n=1 Tax=Brevibacterium daeguense TaxID=909936 RepID=A0ABP8EJ30_9MICO|nr:VOC family protein [Brevibacterium daeguense]